MSNYFTLGQVLELAELGYKSSLESDDELIFSDPNNRQRVLAAIKEDTIERRLGKCPACLSVFYLQVEILRRFIETLINDSGISPDELLSATTQEIMIEVFRLVVEGIPDENLFHDEYNDCIVTGHKALVRFSKFFIKPVQLMEQVFSDDGFQGEGFYRELFSTKSSRVTRLQLEPVSVCVEARVKKTGVDHQFCFKLDSLAWFVTAQDILLFDKSVFRVLACFIRLEDQGHSGACSRSINNYNNLLLWVTADLRFEPSRFDLIISILKALYLQIQRVKKTLAEGGSSEGVDLLCTIYEAFMKSVENIFKLTCPNIKMKECKTIPDDFNPVGGLCDRNNELVKHLISYINMRKINLLISCFQFCLLDYPWRVVTRVKEGLQQGSFEVIPDVPVVTGMVSYYYIRGYVDSRELNCWVPTIRTILPVELWRYIFDLVRSLELSQTSNDDVRQQIAGAVTAVSVVKPVPAVAEFRVDR